MKLYIDTADAEEIIVGLGGKKYSTIARQKKSQKLLPFIDQLLTKEKIKTTEITEIEVNSGPGSYTGIRVGMSVALALGWALDIPVNGNDVSEGKIPEIRYD